jgi:hypothetical protein
MKMYSVKPLLLLLALASSLRADVSEVLLADWAGFSLDVDGDGVADFAGSTSDNLAFYYVTES